MPCVERGKGHEINTQDFIEALKLQRDRAMDEAALAMARSACFQRELEAARVELSELKKAKE